MQPERVATPLRHAARQELHPARAARRRAGDASPWNYPVLLLLNPLAGALAAGNAVMLKPSEVAPATSACSRGSCRSTSTPRPSRVVEGGVAETTELLAAALRPHLLHGQRRRRSHRHAGRRQAPDAGHARARRQEPVHHRRAASISRSPPGASSGASSSTAGRPASRPTTCWCTSRCTTASSRCSRTPSRRSTAHSPSQSADYGRIINARHHRRLLGLLPGSGEHRGRRPGRRGRAIIAPTVLTNVPADAPVMRDEIFGPILPVLPRRATSTRRSLHQRARQAARALPVLERRAEPAARALEHQLGRHGHQPRALMHLAVPGPALRRRRSRAAWAPITASTRSIPSATARVLKKGTTIDPSIMYPPYTQAKESWLKRLM